MKTATISIENLLPILNDSDSWARDYNELPREGSAELTDKLLTMQAIGCTKVTMHFS